MLSKNTINELKNLQNYCVNTPCNDCIFNDCIFGLNGGICCIFECIPEDYKIEEITEKFLDKAVIM